MEFSIKPLTDTGFAAEILDLVNPQDLSVDEFQRLRRAWATHGVLVLRNQHALTPTQHVAFSRRFGPLEIHVQRRFQHKAEPEILIISTVLEAGEPIGLTDAGQYWHSDLSYLAQPSLGSLLHAQELPTVGGDTLFGDMVRAYEALDPALQARLAASRAEHSYPYRNALQHAKNPLRPALTPAQAAKLPPVHHPAIRTHPMTGKRALFVNEGFTTHLVDWDAEESRDTLDRVFAHQTADRFLYRHRWRSGDLVMWDNRATIHYATGCPSDCRRTLYRTTVAGDVPV